jgi:predicted amidohydrolase
MVRVAALEFAPSTDVDEHLTSCLRVIDRAARLHAPKLMVLSAQGELRLDGHFLRAIATAAADNGCAIALHVTLAGDDGERVPVALIYDERGQLAARADAGASPVVEARLGKLGVVAERDACSMEAARSLALRGAQILAFSVSSAVEVEARAAENRAFAVVAGGGKSAIIAPDGRVLARAEPGADAIVAADIDLAEADNKLRPDGTHLFALRRPELYRALGNRPRARDDSAPRGPLSVAVAAPPASDGVEATLAAAADTLAELAREGVELAVLPELFYLPSGKVEYPAAAADLFVTVVRRVAEACAGTAMHVVTSAVEKVGAELFHMGLVIGARGVVARQPQLHVPMRHAWATAGRRLDSFRLPWGRLAVAVGEDLCMPELVKVYALGGVEVLAAPSSPSEAWELSLGAQAGAAENRLCVAVAARTSELGASLVLHPREGGMEAAYVDKGLGASILRVQVSLSDVHDRLPGEGPAWAAGDVTRRGLGVPEVSRAAQVEEPPAHAGDARDSEGAPEAPAPDAASEDAGER